MIMTKVSIHATLAGGDDNNYITLNGYTLFLSTPPSRVATPKSTAKSRRAMCFYPRHPRGWRRQHDRKRGYTMKFLSTPPSRVATRATA